MDCDVLIVGGRVAGSSLALLLAQRGQRVLLVDRDTFPSDTLSTHFMGAQAVKLLDRLGVLAEVEAAGFRRITRVRTYVADCLFEGPGNPGGRYSLAPRRNILDATLIAAAQRAGVDFRERTRVEGLIEEDGRVVGAHLRTAQDEPLDVRALVVVGADGRYSKVAEWVHAPTYNEAPPIRPVYHGYYHGVAPLPAPAVELFFAHETCAFIFPMRPNEDCLAMEIQPEDFETFRADPQTVFEERFRALPGMAGRLRGAMLEGKLQGTRGIPNHFRTPYGPGWALTGDAAYVKDPITGVGIGDALMQSFLLADALGAVLSGADWEESLGAYQRQRDGKLLPMFQATLTAARMRDASPEALAWLRGLLISPHDCRATMQWLAGALPDILPPELREPLKSTVQLFGASGGARATELAPVSVASASLSSSSASK
ncbi:MAG TPA: NAD(P)/FAD-dependent oxidoreductase [Ktedonobacterales bacterium]|nr:NAD(P)/FAD-dependent oxidoreductase [Ktedonobacterales bacterium]